MHLRTLTLSSFRAHARTVCGFAPALNLLYGPNGAGKTNVLEAVHYLCLSKGFVSSQDRYAVRRGDPHLEIDGEFLRDDGRTLRVRMVYVPGEGKGLFVNGAPVERLADVVGKLPVVVCSPEDHGLTAGGPDERRRFMDNILSQSRPLYLDTLLKFRRVLRQRNRLLAHSHRLAAGELSSWNHELVQHGSRLILWRAAFVEEFSAFLRQAYEEIESAVEKPTLRYDTLPNTERGMSEEGLAARYLRALEESSARERRRGATLVGPHRDELVFRLDAMLVRRYASQGQHRTFGLAMKIAKYFYLHDRTGERPVLLLDDVFDHLDGRRSQAFIGLLGSDRIGQALITATDPRPFNALVRFDGSEHRAVHVENGMLRTVVPDAVAS